MSRAFQGGSCSYNLEKPETKNDVKNIICRFVEDQFNSGDDVVSDLRYNSSSINRWIIKMANDEEQDSPTTVDPEHGDLIAYGSFCYPAKDHSIQVIWENHFEIRDLAQSVYVRVGDWYGPTLETWNKKSTRNDLFI